MTLGNEIISVQNLSKTFQSEVLSQVQFKMRQGESLALVGANGAGKSTLIKIILGLVKATEGRVELFAFSPLDPRSRENVGYLPELPSFWPELSALELLEAAAKFRGLDRRGLKEEIQKLLKALGLGARGQRAMGTYSKGMLQRAAIAQTLLHKPKLLILDEPMSGLDPRAQAKLQSVLLKLREQGVSLLISSHALEDIRLLCDRVLVLEKSKLVEDGPVGSVLDSLVKRYKSSEPWDEDPMEGEAL